MKTTIDVPEHLLHRAKIVAAQRRTTLKDLVVTGLDWVLRSEVPIYDQHSAISRLRKGLRLRDQALTRGQVHERRQVT